MSLRDKVDRVEKEYGMSGDFFKFPDGDTRLRVLAEPESYNSVIKGEEKAQWVTYVLVRGETREEDTISPMFMPHGIVKFLAGLEEDEVDGYGFDSYPMPYDIKVNRKGTGLETKYEKLPLNRNAALDLTADQLEAIEKLKPITELAGVLEKKNIEKNPRANKAINETPAEALARSNRNKAELNPMFGAFESSIKRAEDEAALDKVVNQIESFVASNSINSFEADLLRNIVKNKKATLTGVAEEDINVEDIPF